MQSPMRAVKQRGNLLISALNSELIRSRAGGVSMLTQFDITH
jgi:hypothetical protein